MKPGHGGIDLAQNVFRLHGIDRHGQAAWRRRLRRKQSFNRRVRPSTSRRRGKV